MNKTNFHPNLTLLSSKTEQNSSTDLKQAFIVHYDSFIDESNFEEIELYFRSMAQKFFTQGYQKGRSDEKNKCEKTS